MRATRELNINLAHGRRGEAVIDQMSCSLRHVVGVVRGAQFAPPYKNAARKS